MQKRKFKMMTQCSCCSDWVWEGYHVHTNAHKISADLILCPDCYRKRYGEGRIIRFLNKLIGAIAPALTTVVFTAFLLWIFLAQPQLTEPDGNACRAAIGLKVQQIEYRWEQLEHIWKGE